MTRDARGRFVSRAVLANAVLEEAVTEARRVIGTHTAALLGRAS